MNCGHKMFYKSAPGDKICLKMLGWWKKYVFCGENEESCAICTKNMQISYFLLLKVFSLHCTRSTPICCFRNGATTLSIKGQLTTLSIQDTRRHKWYSAYQHYHYAFFVVLSVFMQVVVMLSVVMPGVVMLSVLMLSVVMLSVLCRLLLCWVSLCQVLLRWVF
jgi:hypothetical protein